MTGWKSFAYVENMNAFFTIIEEGVKFSKFTTNSAHNFKKQYLFYIIITYSIKTILNYYNCV